MLNPIICGIATGIIVYLFVYVENKGHRKKQYIPDSASIKIPILAAILTWVFCSLSPRATAFPPVSNVPW